MDLISSEGVVFKIKVDKMPNNELVTGRQSSPGQYVRPRPLGTLALGTCTGKGTYCKFVAGPSSDVCILDDWELPGPFDERGGCDITNSAKSLNQSAPNTAVA